MKLKSFAAETSQGPFLKVNEDGYDFDFENNLYMLFDGFGGSGIGDKCVEEIKEVVKKFYLNIVEDKNSTMPFFYSPRYLIEGNSIINASIIAHSKIYKDNQKKEISLRAGASGIIISQAESILSILSVGNCQCFLLRRGKLEKIFVEDSFKLLSKDTREMQFQSIPSSAFGLYSDLHYQVKEVRVKEDDALIVMSDGIYSRLEANEIIAEIQKPVLNVKTKIQELCKLANLRGNLDNQSCLILQY